MPSLLPLFLSLAMLAAGQQSADSGAALNASCKFTVSDVEPAKPVITGPDDVVKLVHVIEQPDSPVEILSADFSGTSVSISQGQKTHKDCWTIRIRNRSKRLIVDLSLITRVMDSSREGAGIVPRARQGLAPGQEVELRNCGSGGSGGARDNQVRLIVGVEWVRFDGCEYFPSRRIPSSLGMRPYWP